MQDPKRLACAAPANNRGTVTYGQGVDRERVSYLQAGVATYDTADISTRAALLSLLALELVTDHDASLRDKLKEGGDGAAPR